MNSKRALYKPSPHSSVGQKPKSCVLAQGRLVTDPSLKPAVHHVLKENEGDGANVISKHDSAATPRKDTPRLFEKHSPRPEKPADKLDLSDSEVGFPHSTIQSSGDKRRTRRTDVPVFDATYQRTEASGAEVDVVVGYEQSPVRVICHKSQNKSDSEGFGKWTVQVEGVPKVSFLESADCSQHKSRKQTLSFEAPDKDHSLARRAVSVHSPSEREVNTQSGQRQQPHYPQPNFDDSHGSSTLEQQQQLQSKQQIGADADDVHSITSESDVCSVQEFVTQSKPRIISKQKMTHSAKKKAGRFVPSRYMQSAQTVKASSSLLPDKSLSLKNVNQNYSGPVHGHDRSVKKRSVLTQSLEPLRSSYRSSERPSSARKKKPKPVEERPETPVVPLQNTEGAKTSTPTHEVSSMLIHDASAIQAEMSILAAGGSNHSKYQTRGSAQKPGKKKSEQSVSERTLKLLYARYLQSLYLDIQAEKSFKIQEKQEMAEMQELGDLVEDKRKQIVQLRKDVERLKHNIKLDTQLQLQEKSLEPVVSSLPQHSIKHKSLADSLDTTRHQIQTKGIYLPEDEDQFQDSLEAALKESEHLLGELSVMTRTATPKVTDMADVLKATENALTVEGKQLARCNELVSTFQTRSAEENSLKINLIQND